MDEIGPGEALQVSGSDYVASAARAALGGVPFVGSLLVELAGTVIPNQRIDRIANFAAALEARLSELERNAAKRFLTNEEFTELVEEALRQAARSTTDERRQYLADLVKRGLAAEDITFQESKHLLRLLGEISDIEVIWLRFYTEPEMGGDVEFREKHQAVLEPIGAHMGSPQSDLDKETLQTSYKEHLVQLGLLRRLYRTDPRTKEPKFDSRTGNQEVSGYEITSLGRLLLRQVGLGGREPGD
jgi:hypothetical protein